MPSYLLEGHFQLPTHDEPREDLLWIGLKVGTQKRLRFELSLWIAHKDPTQGYGEQARGVPHGRLGSYLDRAIPAPIPVGDLGRLPDGVRIFGHHRQVGQPFTLYARPPYLMGASWRSRLVEGTIQAQAGNEGDRIGELAAALEQFERCVGAIGDGHDLPPWVTIALPARAVAKPTRLSSCAVY